MPTFVDEFGSHEQEHNRPHTSLPGDSSLYRKDDLPRPLLDFVNVPKTQPRYNVWMEEENQDIFLGKLLLRQEEDVVFIRPKGDLSPDGAHRVIELLLRVKQRHGHCFILANLEQAGAIPPETRRLLVEHGIKHRPDAIALCGAGLLARTMNALLFGAMNLLGKSPQNTKQFGTELEGRVWIASERLRLHPKQE